MILGVTGNVMEQDVKHFKAHGANDVLPKPVDTTTLHSVLKKYLRQLALQNQSI